MKSRYKFSAIAAGLILFSSGAFAQLPANATLYASGLNGPRGLKFGPDGLLYIAEAGTGGTTSTGTACAQVVAPIGPYTGGMTARILRVDRSGHLSTVASGLPSAVDSQGDLMGVADLAFVDNQLYALLAGGGCSHGSATVPNALVRVNTGNGSWQIVANLSKFVQNHPVQFPNAGDFEPDGTFYSMALWQNRLYAVEPNHGQVIAIGTDGSMESVLDVSASEGHIVPSAIVERDGNLYLGNLGLFPITPDSSRIMTLTHETWCPPTGVPGLEEEPGSPRDLHISSSKAGFTSVVSEALGRDGLLYVLELSDAAGFPTPGAGKVVRVRHNGEIEDVVTGLAAPTAMTFGPDGDLYISNFGAAPAGKGQILKVAIQPGY